MKKLMFILTGLIAFAYSPAQAANPVGVPVLAVPSMTVSSTVVAAATATVTLSTPTAGSANSTGWYNYITHLTIEMYASGTLTGGAVANNCTVSNLVSTSTVMNVTFPTAEATGLDAVYDRDFASPLQAQQGFQVVVTCRGALSTLWNVVVSYYQAP